MSPHANLIIIRGAPGVRRSELARLVGDGLGEPAAIVPVDEFTSTWVIRHDHDSAAEFDLADRLARLTVVSYLKAGYHVVLTGSYFPRPGGSAAPADDALSQLVTLARSLPARVSIIDLTEAVGEISRSFAMPHAESVVRPDITVNLGEEPLIVAAGRVLRELTGE